MDEWIDVTDEEICKAILFLLEGEKTVTEGAGAATVAALLSKKIDVRGKNVVSIISGGNIDVNALSLVSLHILMTLNLLHMSGLCWYCSCR